MINLIKHALKLIGFKNVSTVAKYARLYFYSTVDSIGSLFFLSKYIDTSIDRSAIKKILLIRLDRLGDMVLTTPAIKALKETYKNASIDILLKNYTKDILNNNPNISRTLVFKKDAIDKDYDIAISFLPGYLQNKLTYISGAKHRIGYSGLGGSFFLTNVIKDDRQIRIRHEVISALETVNVAGATISLKNELEIYTSKEGEQFAENFFSTNKLNSPLKVIAIHPGSRQSYIRWGTENFIKTAQELSKQSNTKVLMIIGKADEHLKPLMSGIIDNKNIIFAENMSIPQMVSVLKRCSLFIGSSTGPMHVASALKVPVVAVFGSTHPLDSWKEWGPWNTKSVVISKGCSKDHCHPSDCSDYSCLKTVTVDDVLKAANKLLTESI